jgi:hypothetical protein
LARSIPPAPARTNNATNGRRDSLVLSLRRLLVDTARRIARELRPDNAGK